jgi:spermidine synthase
MEYSFPRYLLSKQTVDDRALNRNVIEALKGNLPEGHVNITEVGAGMGNMAARLISWGVITKANYIHVDSMEENIRFALDWLPEWAAKADLLTERDSQNQLRVFDNKRDIEIRLECADVFDFISKKPTPADLLIAHAFLDLLPMPESMPKL